MLKRVLGALADGKVAHPRESIETILATEIGELQRKWTDDRSFITDFKEWASKHKDRPTREEAVEKFIHDHMHARVLARIGKAKDVIIAVEALYWEEPAPMLAVKVKVSEGDTVHPSAKFRTRLDFAPEPFELIAIPVAPAPSQKAAASQLAPARAEPNPGKPRPKRPI